MKKILVKMAIVYFVFFSVAAISDSIFTAINKHAYSWINLIGIGIRGTEIKDITCCLIGIPVIVIISGLVHIFIGKNKTGEKACIYAFIEKCVMVGAILPPLYILEGMIFKIIAVIAMWLMYAELKKRGYYRNYEIEKEKKNIEHLKGIVEYDHIEANPLFNNIFSRVSKKADNHLWCAFWQQLPLELRINYDRGYRNKKRRKRFVTAIICLCCFGLMFYNANDNVGFLISIIFAPVMFCLLRKIYLFLERKGWYRGAFGGYNQFEKITDEVDAAYKEFYDENKDKAEDDAFKEELLGFAATFCLSIGLATGHLGTAMALCKVAGGESLSAANVVSMATGIDGIDEAVDGASVVQDITDTDMLSKSSIDVVADNIESHDIDSIAGTEKQLDLKDSFSQQAGTIMKNADGTVDLLDNNMQMTGHIDDNLLLNGLNMLAGRIDGNVIYDSLGNVAFTIDGNNIYDQNHQLCYTVENGVVRDALNQMAGSFAK